MEQVKLFTINEVAACWRSGSGSYIEFYEYQRPPLYVINRPGDTVMVPDPKVIRAPIHCISESGKPDDLIAIEPKLYDLFTDIKIKELRSNLEQELYNVSSLRNNLENTRSALGEMNKHVHEFNNLPWWKRAYLAITKGV